MSIALVIIVVFAVIVATAYFIWLKRTNYLLGGLKAINGPNNYPFIGGALEFLPITETFCKINKGHEKYGKTFKLPVAHMVLICTIDVDFIEYILTSAHCIDKTYVYRLIRNITGDGLVTSASELWNKRRKMILPTFHYKLLNEFVKVFNTNEKVLIAQLQKAAAKEAPFDVSHFVSLCAFDNINETAMGTSVNAQLNEHNEFVSATRSGTEVIFRRMCTQYKVFGVPYVFTSDYCLEKEFLRSSHTHCLSVIVARREQLLCNAGISGKGVKTTENSSDNQNGDGGIKGRNGAFLDLLLQSTIDGQPLSNQDILDEVVTLVIAGFETVSSAMSFTLYCISKHPDVQEKLIEEQRKIYGNDPMRHSTMDDLKAMPYLEMVIKESMRLFPSVPVIGRVAMEDFRYRNLHVRKGTELTLPIFALHKSPDLYPEPEKFDPERFSTENSKKRHPFAYLGFSAGQRNCIGKKFALLEAKLTIGSILRQFELSQPIPEHKLVLPSAIMLHSSSGVYMNMKKRIW